MTIFAPLLALAVRLEVGAHDQQPGQLALRAGRRLEADRGEPGDLGAGSASAAIRARARPARPRRGRADAGRGSPGSAASRSLTRGLYFIVQEPSG